MKVRRFMPRQSIESPAGRERDGSYNRPTRMRRFRVLLKILAAASAALAVVGAVLHLSFGESRESGLSTGAGWGITRVELAGGNLAVEWAPRTPYRPGWAGQVNRYGFRYNIYSDGHGYAWAPVWALTAFFGGLTVLAGVLGRTPKRLRGEHACASCRYDLRATPDRCPECGTEVRPVSPRQP
jgi:hypothetical protein